MEQFSPNIVIDNICMLAVVIVAIYNFARMKKGKNGTGYVFFVVFIVLFSLFYRPEGGDFWEYLHGYVLGPEVYERHWEGFYYWLMDLIPNNFLLWRTAIWLPAAILLAFIYKRMNIPSSNATVFFLVFALIQAFYYLRNSLGFSVLSLAMFFYCNKTQASVRLPKYIIVVSLLVVSWFLHRSMPLYILLAIISFVVPFKKYYFGLALLLIPLLYGFVTIAASAFFELAELWYAGDGSEYIEVENYFTINWKGVVDILARYAPIAYFYYIAFRHPITEDSPDFNYYKVFLIYAFLIYCLSFLFWGQGSVVLHNRFYLTSMLPFAIVVSIYFKDRINSKYCNVFLLLTIIDISWRLFVYITTKFL